MSAQAKQTGPDTGRSKDGGVRNKRGFRVSDAEWEYIQALAESYGQTVSELIRECLLGDMPVTRNE